MRRTRTRSPGRKRGAAAAAIGPPVPLRVDAALGEPGIAALGQRRPPRSAPSPPRRRPASAFRPAPGAARRRTASARSTTRARYSSGGIDSIAARNVAGADAGGSRHARRARTARRSQSARGRLVAVGHDRRRSRPSRPCRERRPRAHPTPRGPGTRDQAGPPPADESRVQKRRRCVGSGSDGSVVPSAGAGLLDARQRVLQQVGEGAEVGLLARQRALEAAEALLQPAHFLLAAVELDLAVVEHAQATAAALVLVLRRIARGGLRPAASAALAVALQVGLDLVQLLLAAAQVRRACGRARARRAPARARGRPGDPRPRPARRCAAAASRRAVASRPRAPRSPRARSSASRTWAVRSRTLASAAASSAARTARSACRTRAARARFDPGRRLAALLDLDAQRLERRAAVAQPLLSPSELGVARLDLLGPADELRGALAERELLPRELGLAAGLALGQLGLARRQRGLATRQLLQSRLARRQLVCAPLRRLARGLERCLCARELGLARGQRRLELAQRLLAALRVGHVRSPSSATVRSSSPQLACSRAICARASVSSMRAWSSSARSSVCAVSRSRTRAREVSRSTSR